MSIPWKYLDRKIIPLVRFLNTNGIETLQSCQGHPKEKIGCYPTLPWVMITKKSFYTNLDLLIKSLHWKGEDNCHYSVGNMHKVYGPKITPWGFSSHYSIVFYNLDCAVEFMKRFKKLKNGTNK